MKTKARDGNGEFVSQTCQVRQVAQQPDEQKAHGQAISRLGFVVGDKLRELQMSVRMAQRLDGLAEEHTRRQIHATRLIQPKMPESDWPISDVVVTAERIAMTEAAMAQTRRSWELRFPSREEVFSNNWKAG